MEKHMLHGKVITDIKRPQKIIVERFKKHDTCKVGDAMGRYGMMHYEIKPLIRGMKLLGPAVTVLTKPGDALFIQKVIEVIKPGDIVVVDSGGVKELACVGERLLGYMKDRGLGGFIVDGAVRDSKGILELDVPVFARNICINLTGSSGPGAINVPIQCGGVPVNPGDIILGDDDGVVVIPQEDAVKVADDADKHLQDELERVKLINIGKSMEEVYGVDTKIKRWE